MTYFEQMGIMAYPLGLCSCLALAIILERLVFFLQLHPVSEKALNTLLQSSQSQQSSLLEQLQSNRFGRVIQELFERMAANHEEQESFFSLKLMKMDREFNRFLPLLKIIATVSPLLGLLGTILGMIEAFEAIAQVSGPITPAVIANGISKALFTTAGGLIIAIPALLAHSLFQIRIASVMKRFTEQINTVHDHLKSI